MVSCEACGNVMPDGTAFCTSCGAVLAPGSAAGRPAGMVFPAGSGELLVWDRKIPLITNPWLVLQCISLPLGIALVFGTLFSLISGSWEMLVLFLVLGGGLALLMLLILLVLQLVTGGGLSATFFISSEGVAYRAGSTTRTPDRVAAGGSAVLGSLSGTGAGMLAISQEDNMLSWQDVRYISLFPGVRSLVLRSKYLISPVVLYCTEENRPRVLSMVRTRAPADAIRNMNG
jgi:hypothetical protein